MASSAPSTITDISLLNSVQETKGLIQPLSLILYTITFAYLVLAYAFFPSRLKVKDPFGTYTSTPSAHLYSVCSLFHLVAPNLAPLFWSLSVWYGSFCSHYLFIRHSNTASLNMYQAEKLLEQMASPASKALLARLPCQTERPKMLSRSSDPPVLPTNEKLPHSPSPSTSTPAGSGTSPQRAPAKASFPSRRSALPPANLTSASHAQPSKARTPISVTPRGISTRSSPHWAKAPRSITSRESGRSIA